MNETNTFQKVADEIGSCGENHTHATTESTVRRTDKIDGNISRERICKKCGLHFFTTELTNQAIELASRKWILDVKTLSQEKVVLEDLIVRMHKANVVDEKIAEDAKAYCERSGI